MFKLESGQLYIFMSHVHTTIAGVWRLRDKSNSEFLLPQGCFLQSDFRSNSTRDLLRKIKNKYIIRKIPYHLIESCWNRYNTTWYFVERTLI